MSSVTCYCVGTCGDDVSCEGNVCYVRLTKVHNGHNVQDIDYGCFIGLIGGATTNNSGVCAEGVSQNIIFKCCSNANFCNQNLTIEAQSSSPSISPSISPPSISLSISPSPTEIPENTDKRFIFSIWIILICILIPLSLVIIFILIVVMVNDFKKCREKYKKQRQMTTTVSSQVILI